MTRATRRQIRRREPTVELKLILTLGFLGLAAATVAAVTTPATEYEISIYRSTPAVFWIGVALALVASLLVSFTSDVPRRLYAAALVLGGSTMWAVVAIPLLRGYYFYGGGDSLSHLGFAQLFADGTMSPLDLLHPGLHVISLTVDWTTGMGLERAILLSVLAFFAIYLVFVPLCVRVITDDDRATAVGLFSALLLLPINNVGVHVIAHPSSQAILFAPLVLYLLFVYLSRSEGTSSRAPTAVGALLALSTTAILFVHPEQALNTLIIFGVILFLGLVYRRIDPGHRFASHSPLYAQTAFFAAIFLLWAPRSPRTQSRFETFLAAVRGEGPAVGGEVAQRAGSVAVAGGSIEELFVKLFLVSLVFCVLAGLVMLLAVTGRLDEVIPDRNVYSKYLTAAFVPLLGATGVIYLSGFGDHYFRYIGFLMMIATILGAAAIVRVIPVLLSRASGPTLRKAVVVLFVALLPLAVLSVHPSPWIYQSSPHVTAEQYGGYETAFAHRDPGVTYAGIGGGPLRYVDAIIAPTSEVHRAFPGEDDRVPPGVLATNVTTHYNDSRYIPVSEGDVWREVVVYNELRYSWSDFRALETTPGVDRIQSNRGLRIYYA